MKLMKRLGLLLLLLAVTSLSAQSKGEQIRIAIIDNNDKVTWNPSEINADETSAVVVQTLVKPAKLSGFDRFEIHVSRTSSKRYAVFGESIDYFRVKSEDFKGFPGLLSFREVVVNNNSGDEGSSSFYDEVMEVRPRSGYFFAKRGTEYSNDKAVDEYELLIEFKLLKETGKQKVWDDLNKREVIMPVYGNPATILTKTIKVVTSDKFKPMPKSSSLGDENDVKFDFSRPY